MSKNVNHIQHIKSSVVENGKPKLPSAASLVEGEIAINYAEGYETISLKNESGDVVTFSCDNYYTDQHLGSAFTGVNSAVTVTQALNNVNIEVDQVMDSGTSASTHAVATQAVYSAVTDNELVWTNAYVVLSGVVSSHTANTAIHRINTVSKVDVSSNTTVTCPSNITGAENDGAQATVIYENTGTTDDYSVTVSSTYKTPSGSQLILTCPKSGFCKVTYINIGGTIYASSN